MKNSKQRLNISGAINAFVTLSIKRIKKKVKMLKFSFFSLFLPNVYKYMVKPRTVLCGKV